MCIYFEKRRVILEVLSQLRGYASIQRGFKTKRGSYRLRTLTRFSIGDHVARLGFMTSSLRGLFQSEPIR